MRIAGRVAVITGAGSGIGRAMALLFCQEGAKVSVVDIIDSNGHETVKMIKERGGVAQFIHTDVTKASEVEQAIQKTVQTYSRLDILCNNAGITHKFTNIENIEEETWNKLIEVNMKGVFLGSKYAVPIMKKQGKGVILNTTSISGVKPRSGLSAYSTSKAGANMFTKALALELAPYNIRVNSICPVGTYTQMLVDTFDKDKWEEGEKEFIATVPLKRLGQPIDMANAALFLVSDEASLITGINLAVDGGRSI